MEIEFSETKGAAFVPNGSCHRQKPFATSRDCSDVLLLDLQAMGNSNAYGGGPTQTPAEQSSLTCTSGPSSNEEKRGR